VHRGIAPYLPNSLAGDVGAVPAAAAEGGYVELPRPVEGVKVRANPVSFDDHFSQATLFYASMSPIERVHIACSAGCGYGQIVTRHWRHRQGAQGPGRPGRRRPGHRPGRRHAQEGRGQ
jgi:catalase